MNKAERFRLKMKKYKQRLKKYCIDENQIGNFFAFRSHGKPCSCSACSRPKYRDTRRTEKINALNEANSTVNEVSQD